jgi:hypothetical protein
MTNLRKTITTGTFTVRPQRVVSVDETSLRVASTCRSPAAEVMLQPLNAPLDPGLQDSLE